VFLANFSTNTCHNVPTACFCVPFYSRGLVDEEYTS
jgi:hypothetical protein